MAPATATPAASPSPRDTAATIASFIARVAAIEADTGQMDRAELPIAPGAGSAGLLTAWRTGPVWRRLRVEADGAGFHSIDNYWLSNGVFLGARLEVVRPGRPAAVDTIWFRDRTLYRWTDPDGRRLNPDARSTQFQVQMMHARLDSLLQRLRAADAVRPTAR